MGFWTRETGVLAGVCLIFLLSMHFSTDTSFKLDRTKACFKLDLTKASLGGNTEERKLEEYADRLYSGPGGELNQEAGRNLDEWLDYQRLSSDSEDEPWAPELENDFSDRPAKDPKQAMSPSHHFKNVFKPRRKLVVAKDGSGHFSTIQEAIDNIPKSNKERVLIKIKAGVYRERLHITSQQKYITMVGEKPSSKEEFLSSQLRTIITYDSRATDLDDQGLPLTTFRSATFAVDASNFIAKYIAFKNTASKPLPGAVGGQAVATRVSGDMAAFYKCRFYGNQDTLYDHKGRHYFRNCYVEGTIDFIFGNGRSLYEGCHLNALSNSGMPGSITAQKRNSTTADTGFAFLHSLVTGYGAVYLGRAWGNDSRVVFANTFMTSVVLPNGWGDWGIPAREKTVYYAEYNCTGPGAVSTDRVHWAQQLTFEQARPFLTIGYINGKKWLQNPKSIEKEELREIKAEERAAKEEAKAHSPSSSHQSSPLLASHYHPVPLTSGSNEDNNGF